MGLGVGIVASMAADCSDQKDLQVINADGLFPQSMTWIGYRQDTVLRRYMLDFIQLFASHLTSKQIDEVKRAANQATIDEIFRSIEIPMRGGCADDVIIAA